jgi:hypothetical protein
METQSQWHKKQDWFANLKAHLTLSSIFSATMVCQSWREQFSLHQVIRLTLTNAKEAARYKKQTSSNAQLAFILTLNPRASEVDGLMSTLTSADNSRVASLELTGDILFPDTLLAEFFATLTPLCSSFVLSQRAQTSVAEISKAFRIHPLRNLDYFFWE